MLKIALLCHQDPNGSIFRILFSGLLKASQELNYYCDFLENFTVYPDVIITHKQYDLTNDVKSYLIDCKNNGTKIVVIASDVYKVDAERLLNWFSISDIILSHSKIHKQFIQSLTDVRVELMEDCIDFLIDKKYTPVNTNPIPKICWFGYPESYYKSMYVYEDIISNFVEQNKLEFYLITNPNFIQSKFPIIPYNSDTFIDVFTKFDGCILSHSPLDWDINTFVKSHNKLTLSIALGVPSITSYTPSYSEILFDTDLMPFTFSGVESFKHSLELLLDKNERKKYLDKSQDYIISNFSYKNTIKQLLNILSK
jgi:glycosyltransferase involved in cell wall biosynthesis